jgi:hypothetical protein
MEKGELGLVKFGVEDVSKDKANEFIGPKGWVSPETMNKLFFALFRR